jgi:uncharacterized membrane protein YsdA (DUF1294 family)
MLAMTITIPWPLLLYAGMSIITFAAYGMDKARADRGRWRISEATLHGLDLLCGFPGGFLGQRIFRHKTRKTGFQVVFWLTVFGHGAFWAWWVGWRRW